MDSNKLLAFEDRLMKRLSDPITLSILGATIISIIVLYNYFRPEAFRSGSPDPAEADDHRAVQSVMSPPMNDLLPPKSDLFTLDQLKIYDGRDPSLPLLVSIKGQSRSDPNLFTISTSNSTGTVFDVSRKRGVYGPPSGSYRIFAGKDASVAFGLSSLKEEDAIPDWSILNEKHQKTLEEWYSFFRKRYNVAGRVVDMPEKVRSQVWPRPT